jgi:hypothetical protein
MSARHRSLSRRLVASGVAGSDPLWPDPPEPGSDCCVPAPHTRIVLACPSCGRSVAVLPGSQAWCVVCPTRPEMEEGRRMPPMRLRDTAAISHLTASGEQGERLESAIETGALIWSSAAMRGEERD